VAVGLRDRIGYVVIDDALGRSVAGVAGRMTQVHREAEMVVCEIPPIAR
jgi:hypothetical protein